MGKRSAAIAFVVLPFVLMVAPAISADETGDGAGALEGLYIGGGVGGFVQGNAAGEVFIGHWWEHIGVEVGLSVFDTKVEYETDDGIESELVDSLVIRVGGAAKLGTQIGFAKPYIAFGLQFDYSDTERGAFDEGEAENLFVVPRIGVDLLAAEHIVIGLEVLSTAFTVYSNHDERSNPFTANDLDGETDASTIELFTGFSVSYLF